MTNSSAVASTRVRCGTARRSLRRHGSPAPTPSARAMGPSSPSMIPTVIRGWSRRSQRGTPAVSDTAFASTAHLASALRRAEAAHGGHEMHADAARRELARLLRLLHDGGAGRDRAAEVSDTHAAAVAPTAAPLSSSAPSAATFTSTTATPSRSCGPKRQIRSSKVSSDSACELLIQDTRCIQNEVDLRLSHGHSSGFCVRVTNQVLSRRQLSQPMKHEKIGRGSARLPLEQRLHAAYKSPSAGVGATQPRRGPRHDG